MSAAAGESTVRRKVVVMFIGGATFAEISGLRWLSMRPDVNADFLVTTTKLINGSTLLDTFVDDKVRQALTDDAST